MTSQEIQTAVAQMQTRRAPRPDVWTNDNGSFSHRLNARCEWADEVSCRTDFRFAAEWEGTSND